MAAVESSSFGDWLRQARESSGLTLDNITTQTRIPLQHLEALEHGVLGLPDFYQRAEVRAFARAVGMDERVALARLSVAVKGAAPDIGAPHAATRARQRLAGTAALAGTVALAAAAVLALVWSAARATSTPAAEEQPSSSAPTVPSAEAAEPPVSTATAADAPLLPAPAAAEPLPPAQVTELVITTHPEGARVTVNGIGWGVSPVTIRYLPPGDKRIRVSKDGYAAAERMLPLAEGRRQEVDIALGAP